MRVGSIFKNACRLRCPRCGRGRLFCGWLSMHAACDHCGLNFSREPGFYLGAIYVNYGLTALIVTATYLSLHFGLGVADYVLLIGIGLYCVVFPLWFFRYARSLWLAFDEYFDPAGESSRRSD